MTNVTLGIDDWVMRSVRAIAKETGRGVAATFRTLCRAGIEASDWRPYLDTIPGLNVPPREQPPSRLNLTRRSRRRTLKDVEAEYGTKAHDRTVKEVVKTIKGHRYRYAVVWDHREKRQRWVYLGPAPPQIDNQLHSF